jgi:hypothetical protein
MFRERHGALRWNSGGAGRSCGRAPDGLAYVQGTRARQRPAGEADALERTRLKFPTPAISVLEFTGTWQEPDQNGPGLPLPLAP